MTKKRAKKKVTKVTRKAAKKTAAKKKAATGSTHPVDAPSQKDAPPPPTVADLLAQSRQAHQEYRDNVPRMVAGVPKAVPVDGDAVKAGDALWRACRLRVEAHALDPTLADPAWQDEAVSHNHDSLLEFYAQQLSS